MIRLIYRALGIAATTACLGTAAQAATVVLYTQNFENPDNFVNDGGDVNIYRSVNQLYGNQPPGFQFAQDFTVETLLVGGSQAWLGAGNPGGGFKDPQAKAGQHVVSMLSTRQDDLLGLSFNIGSFKFLNVQMDISSIDLNNFGGPFFDGTAPTFRYTLYDNPSGAVGLGSGAALSSVDVVGTIAANRWTFDWTNTVFGLDAAGNSNGNVTLRIDLLTGGYAALDNIVIAASDTSGTVDPGNPVPEPGSAALVLLALGALGWARRR